jgi:hypothetical protein
LVHIKPIHLLEQLSIGNEDDDDDDDDDNDDDAPRRYCYILLPTIIGYIMNNTAFYIQLPVSLKLPPRSIAVYKYLYF